MAKKESFWALPAPNKQDLRKYGLLMAVILGSIAAYLWYRDHGIAAHLGGIAGVFLVAGLLVPSLLRPIYTVWMILARILAFINTHLLLAIVFYTIFVLIGAVMRLVRYDPLNRKMEPEGDSYWTKRSPTLPARDHYKRQF